MDDFEPDPKERGKSTFWEGFAAGFMYFLFLLLLEIFVGPYLTEAEAWIMPLVITGLLIWIGSKKEDVELKVFTGATFVLAAILTPFIFEFLEPLGKINIVLQVLPALLIAFGISLGVCFGVLMAIKRR